MNHDPALGSPKELVALYLAGALSPDEHRAFDVHLKSGCDACENEFRRLSVVIEALAAGIEPVEPHRSTRGRLMERIEGLSTPASGHPTRRDTPHPRREPLTRRAARARWRPAGIEGIEIRMLHADPERDRLTAMVRMAPGVKLPAHHHHGPEELLLIEGDMRTDDDTLSAGDYQFSPPGSLHGEATTVEGCTAMIIMPLSALGSFLATGAQPFA